MEYLFSMLLVLLAGAIILMAGILIDREPEKSFKKALRDSFAWGASFFILFSTEFWILGAN